MVEEADVPAAAVVGVAAGEAVEKGIERDVVDVARAGGVELEFGAVGPDARDAAAEQRDLGAVGAGGVVESKIADGDVDPAVDAHADAVRRMVGAAVVDRLGDADAPDEHGGRAIGNAVAVGVIERGQVHAGGLSVGPEMRVQHVNAGADGEQTAGIVDLGERRVPVGDAIAVGVDEFDDAALAGAFAERAVEIDAGVNFALSGNAEAGDARGDLRP